MADAVTLGMGISSDMLQCWTWRDSESCRGSVCSLVGSPTCPCSICSNQVFTVPGLTEKNPSLFLTLVTCCHGPVGKGD